MSSIQVPPDSTGSKVDTETLTDAGASVHRQKMILTGKSGTAEVVVVTNAAAGANDYGLVVRHAGTATVAGSVVLSGTATVAGVVGLTAGTANIGFINNISATVLVAGVVGLTAGTANIGFINNISATVTVAGVVGLTAGTANIGSINNISASVTTAVRSLYANAANPSASRGPRCVIASTSSNATLASAPGAGLAIFVTSIACSNAANANTRARMGTSATPGSVTMMMAQSGGGFVMQFNPPWELSANEALVCSVKPNASEGIFNAHFFVASADAL